MHSVLRSTKLLFFSYYLAFGAYGPYLTRYMTKIGLSGKQIGLLQGLTSLLAFILPPLWGFLTDARYSKRQSFTLALLGMAVGLICYYFSLSFWPMLFATLVFAVFNAPAIPLLDSIALDAVDRAKSYYGNVRMFGSLGYAVSASLMPYLYNHLQNPGSIFPAAVVFLLLALFMFYQIPKEGIAERQGALKSYRSMTRDFGVLIKTPAFLALVLVAFIQRIGLVPYYNFLTVYLEGLNATNFIVGYAWAVAIVGEMVVLFNSEKLIRRFGEKNLLLFSLIATIIRWIVYAKVQLPWVIFGLQWIHGFSFAAMHAVCVKLVDKLAPKGMQVSAQSLYSAFYFGLGGFIGSLLIGALFDYFGGSGSITVTMSSLFLFSALASVIAFVIGFAFIKVNRQEQS